MSYRCPLCARTEQLKQEMIDHIERNHADEIPKDMPTAQYLYLQTHDGKAGVCRYCGKPTEWVDNLGKYRQVCNSPACKIKVRKQYEERMMNSFGKVNLANDPEMQKKMLARKKISGVYNWSDGKHKFTYTGTYEHNIIEWLDKIMGIDPETIQMPGIVINYELEGKPHFWITDLYLTDFNLVIEIKDGMENTNPEFSYTRSKEKAKDDYMRNQTQYNYLKLTHKNPLQLVKMLSELRMRNIFGDDKKKDEDKLIEINESADNATDSNIKISKITKEDVDDCQKTLKKVLNVNMSPKDCLNGMSKIINEKNEVVGYIGFSHYGSSLGIGNFAMKPEMKGHGYGTMVINKLKDRKGLLYCFVDENNKGAINLYKRLGVVHYDKKNKNNEYYVTFNEEKKAIKESIDDYSNLTNEKIYSLCEAISSNYESTVELQNLNTVLDGENEEDKQDCPCQDNIYEKLIRRLKLNEGDWLPSGNGVPEDAIHDQQGIRDIRGLGVDPLESKNEDGGELRTDMDSDPTGPSAGTLQYFGLRDIYDGSIEVSN